MECDTRRDPAARREGLRSSSVAALKGGDAAATTGTAGGRGRGTDRGSGGADGGGEGTQFSPWGGLWNTLERSGNKKQPYLVKEQDVILCDCGCLN